MRNADSRQPIADSQQPCRLGRRPTFVFWLVAVTALAGVSRAAEADNGPGAIRPRPEQAAALEKAEAALAAAPRAAGDPTRPVFHFRPVANWLNDPCGALFYKGHYHLFYQLNPYGDNWATIHWGHARSKDLVFWEHLPIAIAPEPAEVRCNSGCVAVNRQGVPMIFYTRVKRKGARDHRAAVGDAEMIRWRRHPDNPLVDLDTHGGPRFGGGWSDAYVFRAGGRSFMVIGVDSYRRPGDKRRRVAIPLYEALDADYAKWKYRGLLYEADKKKHDNMEVPMFFKLGDKWVLLFHSGGPTEYLIGDFNLETLKFEPAVGKAGSLARDRSLTSPHVLKDDRGRWIMYTWISGFEGGRGWNGCIGLPLVLTISPDGKLIHKPIPELKKLRGKHTAAADVKLDNSSFEVPGAAGDTLEIQTEIELAGAKSVGLSIASPGFEITYDGGHMKLNDAKREFPLPAGQKTLRLHAFLDRSVLELFAGDGRVCLVRINQSGSKPQKVKFTATGGPAVLRKIDVWQVKPIWAK